MPIHFRRRALPSLLAVAALALASPNGALAQNLPFEPAVQLAGAGKLTLSLDTTSRTALSRQSRFGSERVFYGALIAGAALSFQFAIDPDAGGYKDGLTTMAAFPDKAVHALAGWALTGVGIDLGARPWVAAAAVCAAGTAFEFSQGYVSRLDIAADCAGAAAGAMWRKWRDGKKAPALR
ncbi:MAG TPA: hypothetical protein VMM18_11015 [Gemmatimonadaceae bacterium]|nr:hypothetical protein [Gemmatimonadaceae bacterium]